MKTKIVLSAVLLGALLVLVSKSSAQLKKTWKAGVTGNWSEPSNWIPSGVPGASDTVIISSGSCNLAGDSTVARLELNGGALTGSGSLRLTAISTWAAGTISLVGGLRNEGTVSLTSNSAKYLSNGTITNSGTILHTSSSSYPIQFTNGTLNNVANGLFEFRSSGGFTSGGGTNTVNNAGMFRKSIYTGTATISTGVAFNNNGGTIDVQSGTLSIAGGGTSVGGRYTVAVDATVDYRGGTQTFSGRHGGTGAGVVRVSGGTLSISTNTVDTLGVWPSNRF